MTDMRNDITQIASSIWETLFSMPLDLAPQGSAASSDTPLMTGCVQIEGAWNGAVMLQCPQTLAEQLSAELFQPDGEVSSEEVHDTMGELTNMLAGNVKALLPEPSRISLPAVAQGADYGLRVMGTTVDATVSFTCLGQLLVVTLLQRTGEGAS